MAERTTSIVAWPGWGALPFVRPGVGRFRAAPPSTILVFGVMVLAFSAVTIGVEVGLGDPLFHPSGGGGSRDLEDAAWHLGTAFLLVLPVGRRVALWLAPVLALGIDIDHIFGDILPTVDGRTAHNLFFLGLVGVVLWAVQGRSAGLVGSGAVLAHLGVDGGGFPFLGPFSSQYWTLPLAAVPLLLGAGAVLFFLAFRPAAELLRVRTAVAVGLPVVGLVILIAGLPGFLPFLGS